MIEFYVSGQSLKFYSPVIAADSLNYLSAKLYFTDSDWDGCSKWLHFRQGDRVFDAQLDENDCLSAQRGIMLTAGEWEIYLSGTRGDARLTTVPLILTVQRSGLVDAPLHALPMSVAEQLDFNARQALLIARELQARADSGEFDGADGSGLAPLGHFESAAELETLVPSPGDAYSVGSAPPYDIYVWDGIGHVWRNHGALSGVPGQKGEKGTTFFPYLDANGNLSWYNDGGLDNPAPSNIRGPAGNDGAAGPAGPGAYEKAQQAGYTGTEAGFYAALTAMPYHNARHLPGGADPILIKNGNIEDKAVTRAKLAGDALYSPAFLQNSPSLALSAEHLGKTLYQDAAIDSSDVTVTLTQSASRDFPIGAELALAWMFGKSLTLHAEDLRLAIPGEKNYLKGSVKISGRFGMMALKKMYSDSTNGDLWLCSGNVEVLE